MELDMPGNSKSTYRTEPISLSLEGGHHRYELDARMLVSSELFAGIPECLECILILLFSPFVHHCRHCRSPNVQKSYVVSHSRYRWLFVVTEIDFYISQQIYIFTSCNASSPIATFSLIPHPLKANQSSKLLRALSESQLGRGKRILLGQRRRLL